MAGVYSHSLQFRIISIFLIDPHITNGSDVAFNVQRHSGIGLNAISHRCIVQHNINAYFLVFCCCFLFLQQKETRQKCTVGDTQNGLSLKRITKNEQIHSIMMSFEKRDCAFSRFYIPISHPINIKNRKNEPTTTYLFIIMAALKIRAMINDFVAHRPNNNKKYKRG